MLFDQVYIYSTSTECLRHAGNVFMYIIKQGLLICWSFKKKDNCWSLRIRQIHWIQVVATWWRHVRTINLALIRLWQKLL